MKLFLKPGACSLAVHIALEEAGLKYETETVDLKAKVTETGQDFWTINAKGYVPALQLDNGDVLTEVPALVQYVADQAPDRHLAPANGTFERYRLQSWLSFIGTELHKSCSPFFNPAAGDDWKTAAAANLERRLGYANDALAGRPFLLGDGFSVADGYLFTVLNWIAFAKLDLATWPNLAAFHARVAGRPAVQAVMKAEGLV